MEVRSLRDRWFETVNIALLALLSAAVLYPLLFVISASVSNPSAVLAGDMWLWPVDISLTGYRKVLENKELLTGYGNTILYTAVGTTVNLIMTVLAAYPLSRSQLWGRNAITALLVFTMFFSGGLIPAYMVVKTLGLNNTMWALILPGAVSVWNIFITRTFFQSSIPGELQEAASIDGCSDTGILLRIVLPLSAPILAVMVLFYAVGHWNAYFNALIYLTDRKQYPLQLFLREILIQGQMEQMVNSGDSSHAQAIMDEEAIKYAAVVVTNLPIFMLYPFLQKYFVKGVMIGALKG
ncbi:carbohydrate ABC transporter permease [Paenibacillus sp. YN15]|uniref:carbohydrate ABC transporter permease n=1 Tax=Paenibacillus sp. YN15 TaxID=1742774 RepID=UPI000DCF405A|nr:carbohydrate ABC transporter permease [Paenibacillus sp. YN15]RAV06503.1 carbohydrate ABC transporter permease [Paenibacillus sp. YN15]